MSLTKADVIEIINRRFANTLQKKKISETIEILLEIMKETLEEGEDVMISGFGKFCVKEKNARKGRNPATGEDMLLPGRHVVTFKCSGTLRDKMNAK
jgi:integration host factor subunit alpha